jgi:hypothetical protein
MYRLRRNWLVGVACFVVSMTTLPSGLALSGTGGPLSERSSAPLTARMLSRTISDSSRRSGIRQSRRLSGSIAACSPSIAADVCR